MDKSWPVIVSEQNSPSNDLTIFDSSSNSDEENIPDNRKKRVAKRLFFENKKTAIKRRKMIEHVRKKFKFKRDEKKINHDETFYNICDQTDNTKYDILNTSQSSESSPLKEYTLSPILGRKKYRRSPILEKKFTKKPLIMKRSPILSKKFRRKKKKENLENTIPEKCTYYTNIIDESINLTSNLEIINSNSQDSLNQANIDCSDDSLTAQSISSNPSTDSVIQVDVENSGESQRTLNEIQNILSLPSTPSKNKFNPNSVDFIYKSSPVKRKFKPKKGTLAFRLQELLKSQKSSVSFWRHEIYLESTSGFKRIVTSEEIDLTLKLTVKKIQIEYDRVFLECSEEYRMDENVLLVLSKNFLKTGIVEESEFVLYPPYIRKKCNYIENVSDIIFNAHKIMYNNKLI